ncbi:hypothetical protein [Henriciella aquimarina]|uniref:hypothetical protein n=1 Tax=Henriciella aquimarina TaxID=545261 RepID=UPI000A006E47|nr:hypothetical protein [Henriciella aquimarina]
MTDPSLRPASLAREAVATARTLAVGTLPGLALFALAAAGWAWFNHQSVNAGAFGSLGEQGLWLFVGLMTIFVGCFWSADMYRKALPEAGERNLFGDAGRLFLANLAVYGLYFLLFFFLTLFFSLLVGILLGTAGYDPSQQASPESVSQSMQALSESGGAVLLYLLMLVAMAGLVWLGLRLFLFGVATVAERRVTIFRSWSWTSRHVSRLALVWVFLQLVPWLVAMLLVMAAAHAAGLTGSAQAAGATPALPVAALTGLTVLLLAPFFWLGHGLAVVLYKRLAPNRVDAETTFG